MLCTSHPGAAEPIFVFRFCFSHLSMFSSNTVGVCHPLQPPAPPPFLALDVSKVPLIFLGWAISPEKGRNSKIFSCLALQGLSSGRWSLLVGSFTPERPSWGTGGAGLGFMGRSQPCSSPWVFSPRPVPEPSLALRPLVLSRAGPRAQGWQFVQRSSFPNPFRKENLAWAAGLLRVVVIKSCSQPWSTPTLTGVVHKPQSHRKAQGGSWLWVLLADMMQFKTLKSSFEGNFSYGNSKNSQSGAGFGNLIDLASKSPKPQLFFTRSCFPSHLLYFSPPLSGVCNET